MATGNAAGGTLLKLACWSVSNRQRYAARPSGSVSAETSQGCEVLAQLKTSVKQLIGFLCATTCFVCALASPSSLSAQAAAVSPAPAPSAVSTASTSGVELERRPHLSGRQVTLPLTVVKGYLFFEGEINGVQGKLIFDVGEESALAINSHRISPPDGVIYGTGYFGSGQTFQVARFPVIDDLKLPGGLEFKGSTHIRGNTGQQLEDNITPDFIGWIGLDFFDGYVMKLDLQKPVVTFYRNDDSGIGFKAAIEQEQVLQVISFDNKGHRNFPVLPVHVGTSAFVATVDTGSHTALWLNAATIAQLTKEGRLIRDGDNGYSLIGLKVGEQMIDPIHVEVNEGRVPFAARIGVADQNVIVLGYEFLRRFKSVWDYQNQTLTLAKL